MFSWLAKKLILGRPVTNYKRGPDGRFQSQRQSAAAELRRILLRGETEPYLTIQDMAQDIENVISNLAEKV